MWQWLLVSGLLTSPSQAGDPDKARIRLERQAERHQKRRTETEERFQSVCQLSAYDPEDHQSARKRLKAESALIAARSREIGCSSRLEAWERPAETVEVLFATNREQVENELGEQVFSNWDFDGLSYGVATVAIPARHPAGALDKGLEVTSVTPLTDQQFRDALQSALAEAGTGAELLAYVHGYNNSFSYATRRLGQIASDLDRPVVPVLFSWPSSGGTWLSGLKYTFDENAAARSSAPFADLLEGMVTATSAPVTLMAHSMGSRVVADALLDLDRQDRLVRPLADLVFAAPDIDVSVFARRYLETTLQSAQRFTVYCASDDRALLVSGGFHGGYDRLGSCSDTATDLLDRQQIEIVDASKLWVSLVDHDKVASSPRLLADLRQLVDGIPAGSRGLIAEPDRYVLPP